jgi:hypothetical protein
MYVVRERIYVVGEAAYCNFISENDDDMMVLVLGDERIVEG